MHWKKLIVLHNEKATGYVAGGPHIPPNKVNTIHHVRAKRLEPTDEHDSLTKNLFRKTYTKNCHMSELYDITLDELIKNDHTFQQK
ncbi:hypothetical protein [Peribacillus simplex]|uniref:hypothetical protein n=1 Tax=Peribacillus simplex TaxID=1478 RepID=UPI003D2D918F